MLFPLKQGYCEFTCLVTMATALKNSSQATPRLNQQLRSVAGSAGNFMVFRPGIFSRNNKTKIFTRRPKSTYGVWGLRAWETIFCSFGVFKTKPVDLLSKASMCLASRHHKGIKAALKVTITGLIALPTLLTPYGKNYKN